MTMTAGRTFTSPTWAKTVFTTTTTTAHLPTLQKRPEWPSVHGPPALHLVIMTATGGSTSLFPDIPNTTSAIHPHLVQPPWSQTRVSIAESQSSAVRAD